MLEPDMKSNKDKLIDFLTDELKIKSIIIFNVWADDNSGHYDNLGSAEFCLSSISG